MPYTDIPYAYVETTVPRAVMFYNGNAPDTIIVQSSDFRFYDPRCVRTNSKVYVVWHTYGPPDWDFEIWFASSADGGDTFNPPVNLSNDPGAWDRYPDISLDGSGNIYVAWISGSTIYFRKSLDGGLSWLSVVIVSGALSGAPRIAAHSRGQNIAIIASVAAGVDLAAWLSSDGGLTWGAPILTGAEVLYSYYGCDLKFSGDILYAASTRTSLLYLLRSADFGATWAVVIATPGGGADAYTMVGVYTLGDNFWAVYRYDTSPNLSIDCYFTLDDFGSWSWSRIASGSYHNPTIDSFELDLHTVWSRSAPNRTVILRSSSGDDGANWAAPDFPSVGNTLLYPSIAESYPPLAVVAQTYFFLA